MLLWLSRIKMDYVRVVLMLAWLPVEVVQFALVLLRHGAFLDPGPWKRACLIYCAAMDGAFVGCDVDR